ncbi:MAG: ATP-binding cassette domain-containing protein, partial [Candidatus Micrarchaeia archaeon]
MQKDSESVIEVDNVSKSFKTYEGKEGTFSFLRRKFYYKNALNNVNFNVKRGEIVALLGRNGSGKSTLIKLMTGILHPDTGMIRVLGMDPWKEREKLAMHIGVVFGSTHPQLFWDLPPIDTFEYIKELYNIDKHSFEKRLHQMIEMLDVEKVYKRQTR